MSYRARIEAALTRAKRTDLDPVHVEAHLRAELGGTLDHVPPAAFARNVRRVLPLVDAMSLRDNDALARSYGLRPRD